MLVKCTCTYGQVLSNIFRTCSLHPCTLQRCPALSRDKGFQRTQLDQYSNQRSSTIFYPVRLSAAITSSWRYVHPSSLLLYVHTVSSRAPSLPSLYTISIVINRQPRAVSRMQPFHHSLAHGHCWISEQQVRRHGFRKSHRISYMHNCDSILAEMVVVMKER